MIRIVFALLVAAAAPAWAASPPGTVTLSPGGKVAITAPPCAALMAGAAYVPGVDGDGNAVAPADLPHTASPLTADDITIELDAKLAQRFGAGVAGVHLGRASLGTITVHDGNVYFNGTPLAADASGAVVAACRGAKP